MATDEEREEIVYHDAIATDVVVHLAWFDRLRVLFGWKPRLHLHTDLEWSPGRYKSRDTILTFVPPDWMPSRARPIYIEERRDDGSD